MDIEFGPGGCGMSGEDDGSVGSSGPGGSDFGGKGDGGPLDLGGELIEWDQSYMKKALDLAVSAYEQDEVPVGAIVVLDGRVIGSGWNQRESLRDPTAHAEMIAITQAAAAVENWRLERCTLYVTLEPCPMCAGAIVQARIPRIVYGAVDPKGGAVDTLYKLLDDSRLNHRSDVTAGVMAADCGAILSAFFQEKRRQGKK
ncbi:MAG: tRNA adenosine(34) deaminase TadA [Aureliella sp.]